MKKVIYGTLLLFVGILVLVIAIASTKEVVQVEYRDGEVVVVTE